MKLFTKKEIKILGLNPIAKLVITKKKSRAGFKLFGGGRFFLLPLPIFSSVRYHSHDFTHTFLLSPSHFRASGVLMM